MDIEIIDGTVAEAVISRSNGKVILYKALAFDLADGSQRTLENVAVAPTVDAAIVPGTQGRFYAYKAIDHRGLLAMRCSDGRAAFAMPSGNERIMLIVTIVGFASLIVVLVARGALTILGLLLAVGGSIGYGWYRQLRTKGKAAYDADAK